MKDENLKDQAIEDLLQLQKQKAGNPHFDRLRSAFNEPAGLREPDFAKQKEIIRNRWQQKQQTSKNRRYYLPAAAAALIAISAGVWLLSRTQPMTPAETIASVIRPEENFRRNLSDSLQVYFRSGAAVTERRSQSGVVYEAGEIAGHFQFKPNAKLRSVQVRLPQVTFSVIGTEFIVTGNAARAFLAVKSGVVKATHAQRDYLVKAGEFWSLENGEAVQGRSGITEDRLFSGFNNAAGDLDALISGIIRTPAKPEARPLPRIAITLKSGSELTGLLVSEDASALYVKTAATGGETIRVNKEEIAKRSQVR